MNKKYLLVLALSLLISTQALAAEPFRPFHQSQPQKLQPKLATNLVGLITEINPNSYVIEVTKDGVKTTKTINFDSKTKIQVRRARPEHKTFLPSLGLRTEQHSFSLNQPKTTTLQIGDTVRIKTKENSEGTLLALSINQRPALRLKK